MPSSQPLGARAERVLFVVFVASLVVVVAASAFAVALRGAVPNDLSAVPVALVLAVPGHLVVGLLLTLVRGGRIMQKQPSSSTQGGSTLSVSDAISEVTRRATALGFVVERSDSGAGVAVLLLARTKAAGGVHAFLDHAFGGEVRVEAGTDGGTSTAARVMLIDTVLFDSGEGAALRALSSHLALQSELADLRRPSVLLHCAAFVAVLAAVTAVIARLPVSHSAVDVGASFTGSLGAAAAALAATDLLLGVVKRGSRIGARAAALAVLVGVAPIALARLGPPPLPRAPLPSALAPAPSASAPSAPAPSAPAPTPVRALPH